MNHHAALNRPGMLSPAQRILHHATIGFLGLSGVGLFWMKYVLEPSDDPFTVVNHPWQPHALDLHVLAAPLWLIAVGMMLQDHVLGRLRNPLRRRGRRSGAGLTLLLVPMVASGYLLQVATIPGWRSVLIWTHVGSSMIYLSVFLLHGIIGRRTLRQLHEEARLREAPGVQRDGVHLGTGRSAHRHGRSLPG